MFKEYRAHIYEKDNPDVIDITVTLADPPNIPTSPILRPSTLAGEGVASSFNILDTDSVVTNILSSLGRMSFLGRRFLLQERADGGSWENIFGGRITNITLNDNLGTYSISTSDEIQVLRNSDVFTDAGGGSTQIFPAGRRGMFKNRAPLLELTARIKGSLGVDDGKFAFLVGVPRDPIPKAEDLLNEERQKDEPFEHLRININGVDYRIDHLPSADKLHTSSVVNPNPWVVHLDENPVPEVGDRVFIHAPFAPPTDDVPLHVGIALGIGNEWEGSNPIGTLKKVFDKFNIRYNESNIDDFIFRYRGVSSGWRVTSAQNVSSWLDANILIPLGIAITQSTDGTVELRDFRVPENIVVNELFEFNESNTRMPYPSWEHSSRDAVKEITFSFDRNREISLRDRRDNVTLPLDFYDEESVYEDTYFLDDDEESNTSHQSMEVNLQGYRVPHTPRLWPGVQIPDIDFTPINFPSVLAEDLADRIAVETFSRYGDGPIRGTIRGMSDSLGTVPGDIVVLNFEHLPNPLTSERGGERLVQIMRTRYTPSGPEYDYIDLGHKFNPLAAPTLSASLNTDNPRNWIDFNVTDVASGAETIIIEVSVDEADRWFTAMVIEDAALGTEDNTGTLRRFPANTQVHLRARVIAPGRLPSDWDSTNVTTETIDPPDSLNVVAKGAGADLSWNNTNDEYDIVPVFMQGTTGDLQPFVEKVLPPESDTFVFDNLIEETLYTVGVQYVDYYGGVSVPVTDTITTGTAEELRTIRKIVLAQARSSDAVFVEEEKTDLFGFEVSWTNKNIHANTRIQLATDLNFSNIEQDFLVDPGVSSTFVLTPLDNIVRYIRVRHERDGFAEVDWSPVVRGQPTRLLENVDGEDGFPSGYGFLSLTGNGFVIVNIGSDDPDTDKAYYTLTTDDFLDPEDDGDPHASAEEVDFSDFPLVDVTTTQLETSSDNAFLWVRFWNEETGFSPSAGVKHRIAARDVAAPTEQLVRSLEWVWGGGPSGTFDTRALDVEVRYPADTQSLRFIYGYTEAESPDVSGAYNLDTTESGPHTIIERLKEDNGTTIQEWDNDPERSDVFVTVQAWDDLDATGTLISQDTRQISSGSATAVIDVGRGGTAREVLTPGSLLLGAGVNPVDFLEADTSNRIPISDGSTWASQPFSELPFDEYLSWNLSDDGGGPGVPIDSGFQLQVTGASGIGVTYSAGDTGEGTLTIDADGISNPSLGQLSNVTLSGAAEGDILIRGETDNWTNQSQISLTNLPSLDQNHLYARTDSGSGTPSTIPFTALPFDEYLNWTLEADSGTTIPIDINSADNVLFSGGAGISTEWSTGTLTIVNTAPHVGTNISIGGSGNSRTIVSSTGSNANVPLASGSTAGFMSTDDFSKLSNVAPNADAYIQWNLSDDSAPGVPIESGFQLQITGAGGITVSYSAGDTGEGTLTIEDTGSGGASSLNELSDVSLSSPTSGDLLIRGSSNWENQARVSLSNLPTLGQDQLFGRTTSGTGSASAINFTALPFDEYLNWTLEADSGTTTPIDINSGNNVEFSGGSGISTSWSTGTLTFTNTSPHVGTNLGQGGSGDNRTVTSSTGSNVTITTATTSNAGFMSTTQVTKLNSIDSGAQVNEPTNLGIGTHTSTTVQITSSTGSNVTLPNADGNDAGILTASNQTIGGAKTFNARPSAARYRATGSSPTDPSFQSTTTCSVGTVNNNIVQFIQNGSEVGRINTGNVLLFGTTSQGNAESGGGRFSGRSQFDGRVDINDPRKTSARWLKTNIEYISPKESLDRIMKLIPSYFDWKKTGVSAIGGIADEVSAVDYRYGDDQSISIDAITFDLVGAIQNHEERLNKLEKLL